MVFDLSKLPNIPMWIITFVFFVLTTWASLGNYMWLGNGYLWSNYFVILLGLWSERDQPSPKPVQFFLFGMCFTFLNDILSLSVTYGIVPALLASTSIFQFNAAMAIILVIFKPVACLFIFKEWQERVNSNSGLSQSSYETLGGSSHPYGGFQEQQKIPPPQYQPPRQPFP